MNPKLARLEELQTLDGPDSAAVAVLAPVGRDGPASAALLREAGLAVVLCAGLPDLMAALRNGVAAVFVAEEALFGRPIDDLLDWVREQPPWSELPFVMLTSQQLRRDVALWRAGAGRPVPQCLAAGAAGPRHHPGQRTAHRGAGAAAAIRSPLLPR